MVLSVDVYYPLSLYARLSLLAILAYAVAFRIATLDRPFDYDDEATGSFYGIAARNYLRFAWADTRAMPVVSMGERRDVPVVFYADHSPLVPLMIAPVYKLFGFGEWQTRLPTAVATLLSIVALFATVRRFGTERAALVAAALFAAMPMTLYFGGQPEVLGMPLVLGALLTVLAYCEFHHEPASWRFALLLGAFTLAAVSDWPAFLLVPVLASHFVITRPQRDWWWMAGFCLVGAIVFAALYVYIAWGAQLPWNWMIPLVKGRAAVGGPAPFTASQWFRTAWSFNLRHHTLPLLALTAAWLLRQSVIRARPQPGARVAGLLLAWGILHVAVARQGVYNHEWWWWPLTPGIAVASALLIDDWLTTIEQQQHARWPSFVAGFGVVSFAAWTTAFSYAALYPADRGGPFSALELGRAIQIAAPAPNDLSMLTWSGDDPEVFFYADRSIRADIWTVADFTGRLSGADADLVFSALQPWPGPATGLVFPAYCRPMFPALYEYLAARYPRVPMPDDLKDKFEVFKLRL